MNILVLNAGSSSIKYQLRQGESKKILTSGLVERIGTPDSRMINVTGGQKVSRNVNAPSHGKGLELVFDALVDRKSGVLGSISEISAVGHRVLHCGFAFTQSIALTKDAVSELEKDDDLAPLHNPYNTLGIREAMRILPGVPHVAVFDTTFFLGMPKYASEYALPYEYAEQRKIRRYGIHGTSYRYVTREAVRFLDKPLDQLRMIVCHLGSGSSLAAVKHGTAIDTTAGFTPLEGLMMGTRSGDLDPGVIFFLERRCGLSINEIDALLNHKSGLLGISGVSNDMRDVLAGAQKGHERCRLAVDMYVYRAKKYIGAYAVAMGGLDALVFTGGVGENAAAIRSLICADMELLGIRLDESGNAVHGSGNRRVSTKDSRTDVLVIPTDEESVIAEDTLQVIAQPGVLAYTAGF